ncbi:hypothetical protein Acr_10g0008300 [Actinidia rufa]|uniref:Uncharacterized protein n=1 Tax=Actinidia rufa TaxID=165716 RepID=A0A7J0F9U9_9ERIC|nr:hypothetical protein Acr_10g0008300 [Actinidia rufa]
MPTAQDMMINLKEMFGEQGRSARQDVMRNLLNTKMAEGTIVREHALKMIGFLNELEILGDEIDADSQIDIILQSSPDSFNQFRLNYLMNKNHYTLSELMNELHAAEGIIKSKKHVLMVSAWDSSKIKPKGKKVMKKNKVKHVNKGEAKPRGVQISDVLKGKCFCYIKYGHWKRNYPVFIASKKQGMIESLVGTRSLAPSQENPEVMPPRRSRGRRGAAEPEDQVDRIERILEGFIQVVHDVHNNNNHDDAPQQPAVPMPGAGAMPRTTIKQFQQLRPPTFYGTFNPTPAESWLLGIERKKEDRRKCEQRTKLEMTKFGVVEWEFVSPTKECYESRKQ